MTEKLIDFKKLVDELYHKSRVDIPDLNPDLMLLIKDIVEASLEEGFRIGMKSSIRMNQVMLDSLGGKTDDKRTGK